MKTLLATLLFLTSELLLANCRGCCSHHGGVACMSGVTQCRDGSSLSKKCSSKGCNKCPTQETQTKKKTYKRSYFTKWTDKDRDCLNTRHEILKARSKSEVSIQKSKSGGCRVINGKWDDYYFNEVLTESSEIDIDHLVPLKHAFDSGADQWDQAKRDQFATDPQNLVITNLSYNRKKGAKTILEWMPIDRAYACRYTDQWLFIKKKYDLKISRKEIEQRN